MKLTIKRWDNDAEIYCAEAGDIGELLAMAVKDSVNLYRARLDRASLDRARLDRARLVGASLDGASLDGASLDGASLDGARLDRASLDRASLDGASLDGATVIETGETWGQYLESIVPALLTAGGKSLSDIVIPAHWECHSWDNCPLAEAFSCKGIEGVPLLLKPRADQFIRYFDAKLISAEQVGKKAA